MFCSKCGEKLDNGAQFCSKCGEKLRKSVPKTSFKEKKENIIFSFFKKVWAMFSALSINLKGLVGVLLILLITAIVFLIVKVSFIAWIILLVIFGVIIFLQLKLVKLGLFKVLLLVLASFATSATILAIDTSSDPTTTKDITNNSASSIVSAGVNTDDLGNIVNGQFYFVEDNTAYYSTFDTEGVTHVYSKNLKTGDTKKIFDGFGWSFVVYKDWLYFSGNPGVKIDATYKLYRVRLDGTDLQLLNSNYTYNMHFYKEWIYYMRQADHDADIAYIYRASLDGSNETQVVADTGYQSIIYENKLYYTDSEGYLNKADIDGLNSSKLYSNVIEQFVIGQGKILMVDSNYNIIRMNPDGSNIKTIRETDGYEISRLNSYKNTIFFATYGEYSDDYRAYDYSVYSIDMNGSNEKLVYSGISSGIWTNVVDGKLFVLDYAQDFVTNKYIAIARFMNLDGSSVTDLYR